MVGRAKLFEVGGIVLALALGYLMLLAVPAVSAHLTGSMGAGAGLGRLGSWVLSLGAMGLALAGGAALVLVLVQLVAEARRRPYAFLSPLLAAFSACLLIGLGASLPLPGIPAAHVAVFALVVAVAGGALLGDERPAVQATGLALALWPSVSLLVLVWASTGKVDPAAALWSLAPEAMSFVVLLLVSSFAIATLGLVVSSSDRVASSEALLGQAVGRVEGVTRMAVGSSRSTTPLALAATARYDTPSGKRPVQLRDLEEEAPREQDVPKMLGKLALVVVGVLLLFAIGRSILGASTPPLRPAEISLKPMVSPTVTAVDTAARNVVERSAEKAGEVGEERAPVDDEPRQRRSRRHASARSERVRTRRVTRASERVERAEEPPYEAFAATTPEPPAPAAAPTRAPAATPTRAPAATSAPEPAPAPAPKRSSKDSELDELMTSVLAGQK